MSRGRRPPPEERHDPIGDELERTREMRPIDDFIIAALYGIALVAAVVLLAWVLYSG